MKLKRKQVLNKELVFYNIAIAGKKKLKTIPITIKTITTFLNI